MNQDTTKNEIAEIKEQVRRQGRLLRWSLVGWVAVLSVLILGTTFKSAPFYQEIQVV